MKFNRPEMGAYDFNSLRLLLSKQKKKTNKNQIIRLYEQANTLIDKYEEIHNNSQNAIEELEKSKQAYRNALEYSDKETYIYNAHMDVINKQKETSEIISGLDTIINKIHYIDLKVEAITGINPNNKNEMQALEQEPEQEPEQLQYVEMGVMKSFINGLKKGYKSST